MKGEIIMPRGRPRKLKEAEITAIAKKELELTAMDRQVEIYKKEAEYYKANLDQAYLELAQAKERLANFQEAVNVLARAERLRIQSALWENNGKRMQSAAI
jgi:hypothetical protein